MLVVSKMSVLTVYIEKNMVDSFIAFVCYNDKKKLCIFASTDVTMGINIFAMTTMNKKIAHLKYLNRLKKKKKTIWILGNDVYLRQSANEQFFDGNWVIVIWHGWKTNLKYKKYTKVFMNRDKTKRFAFSLNEVYSANKRKKVF